MRVLTAGTLFVAAWLAWSGVYTPLLLFLGAVSCVLVMWLARRSGFFDVELYALHLIPRLPGYLLWLTKEIVRCNIAVARIVLSREMPIEPTVITIDASELPAVGQVILANSIGLTPGSIATDIQRGMIEVHCLTRATADLLRGGEMVRRVRSLSGA